MASKSSQPALYEKMRTKPVSSDVVPQPMEAAPRITPLESSSTWLSPGRAVRLPVGYLLLAIGLAILLLAAMFVIGHQKGYGHARTEFDQTYLSSSNVSGLAGEADSELRSLDPLIESNENAKRESGGRETSKTRQSNGLASDRKGEKAAAGAWGPVVPKTDPRVIGKSYFVLATTYPDGAERLANFCRSNGLETYVLPCDNPNHKKFRLVVAFPGFDSTARLSREVQALDEKIRAVGLKWKASERGASDLSDFLAITHD